MSLEPLGISSEDAEGSSGRRIETMTPLQVRTALIGFISCIILVQIAQIFGPPFRISKNVRFDAKSPDIIYRKFNFNFSQMNYWNDFLVCDLLLANTSRGPTILDIHFSLTSRKGSSQHSSEYDLRQELVLSENTSQKIRIFENNVVDFDSLNLTVLIDKGSATFDGVFMWSYADPAHSIVQMSLRIVSFFVAALMLIGLLFSGFNVSRSHVTVRLMLFLDVILMFASDPFYVITYFDEVSYVKIVDTLLRLLLVICANFTALTVLNMRGLIHRDVGVWWLFVRFLPFLGMYALCAAPAILEIVFLGKDPLSESNTITKALAATKLVMIVVYAGVLIFSVFRYRADLPQEYDAAVAGALLMFATTALAEFAKAFETLLVSGFAVDKFTFWACVIYVILFNFFNWPVHASVAEFDSEQAQKVETTVL